MIDIEMVVHRSRHNDDDVTRRIKIDFPTFNGTHDSKVFSDWLTDIDYYCDWYDMPKECNN